jgi:hypothetical protein
VWYDQSGFERHATQPTSSLQPKFNFISKYVAFKPSGAKLNLPYSVFPTGNGVYTFTLQHHTVHTNGGVFGVGQTMSGQSINFRREPAPTSYSYQCYWWIIGGNIFPGYADNNVISETYDGSNRRNYINNQLVSTVTQNNRNGQAVDGFFGTTIQNEPMDGELFYFITSNSVLVDKDRGSLETYVVNPTSQPSRKFLHLCFYAQNS